MNFLNAVFSLVKKPFSKLLCIVRIRRTSDDTRTRPRLVSYSCFRVSLWLIVGVLLEINHRHAYHLDTFLFSRQTKMSALWRTTIGHLIAL